MTGDSLAAALTAAGISEQDVVSTIAGAQTVVRAVVASGATSDQITRVLKNAVYTDEVAVAQAALDQLKSQRDDTLDNYIAQINAAQDVLDKAKQAQQKGIAPVAASAASTVTVHGAPS